MFRMISPFHLSVKSFIYNFLLLSLNLLSDFIQQDQFIFQSMH